MMSVASNVITVPEAPVGVCFSREAFLKDEFSVDSFLQELRLQVPLETLRDDLGIYLKVLRSAMIELINRDYADFVNLSSNLVGLDKVISSLELPLGTIREEIQGVQSILEENQDQLHRVLAEKEKFREKRRLLESLLRLPTNISKLEKLVASLGKPRPGESQDNLLERAASQYNRLHHDSLTCHGTEFMQQNVQRMEAAYASLLNHLEQCLLNAISEQRQEELRCTLRVYALLDKCSIAEAVLCRRVVRPALESKVSEQALQSDPQDLRGVLANVKEWIQQHLSILMKLTLGTDAVGGYNILLHCVWPEFSARLQTLPVFVQGNASLLHERYVCTMNLIDFIESKCGDVQTVQQLRVDPDYEALINRWNLPVYFQIRLQEIGLSVETAILTPFAMSDRDTGIEPQFMLAVTQAVWTAIHRAWAPDVFIDALAHRFWKLTLQLVARYQSFVLGLVQQVIQKKSESALPTALSGSISSSRLSEMDGTANARINHSVSMPRLNPAADSPVQVDDWVLIYVDVVTLRAHLPSVLTHVLEQLGCLGKDLKTGVLEGAFSHSIALLAEGLTAISEGIVKALEAECVLHLRFVTDIPRLFRRTNRERPCHAGSYVAALLQPLALFKQRTGSVVEAQVLDAWIQRVTSNVAKSFSVSVVEVLTSVSKTEESLRRLRKARTPVLENSAKSKFLSDDDKIRWQFIIDVENFVRQVAELGLPETEVCQDLLEVVHSTKALVQKS
nr:EOG090X03KZ [Lepidurus arcticus]